MDNKIKSDIAELVQYRDKLKPKYLRNLRLYTYSMNVSLDQIREGNMIGYWGLMNSDYTSSINENVIQSVIDSLTSQLASKHARPLFSTVDGTFKQMQIAKQTQQYFDYLFDEQDVNKTITNAFRDACIFGKGYVYIDAHKHTISKALPWQVIYRPSEETYGDITRVLYERKDYPTTLLSNYKGKEEYVTKRDYWDTEKHIHISFIDDKVEYEEKYLASKIPFVILNYNNPVYGKDTTSIVDLLYGIQMKLDELYGTISEAIRLNPAQTFFVPKSSDVKATSLTNRVGQVFEYNPIEGVNNPVFASTPNFIADQYISMVEQLKKDAFELAGVSQLSAQSRKPTGIDSGVALKTMNDIESERFEVQYKEVIRAYCEVAKICICTFDPEDDILPSDRNRLKIKWQDVLENYDNMKIQFSSMDYLSRDPSTKIQQINALVSNGIIPQSRAAIYFDMPDLDSAYNFANNSINAVMAVINQAIVNKDFTIPDYIPLPMLKSEIINTMLSLKSVENEQNILDIESLKMLYQECVNKESQTNSLVANQAQQSDEQMWQQQLQREAQQAINLQVAQAQGQIQAQELINQATNNTNNIGV